MKIRFVASDRHTYEVKAHPQPASKFIPDWWKEMPVYANGDKKFDLYPQANVTAKRCFPLLDAIGAGYIFPLWADLLVTTDPNGFPFIKWGTAEPVVNAWPREQVVNYEIPEGYTQPVFKNMHGWIIETPKNYSCLITHPIGHPNLPFRTLTGVVDTDSYRAFANSPFVVKKGFEGIIERGTPMFQVIPFKRDSWESEIAVQSEEDTRLAIEKVYSKIVSAYGRNLRSNKEYK